jgi:hypothetical protein
MPKTKRRAQRHALRSLTRATPRVGDQQKLITSVDHGGARVIDPAHFAPKQQGGGWGPFIDSFLRLNERALQALDIQPEIAGSATGAVLRLKPAGRAGAIPLRSAQTGSVTGGFVVRPRFGWAGVGRVLTQTGWHASTAIQK